MHGMLHPSASAAGAFQPRPILGILYAEDFDEPSTPEAPLPEPAPVILTQADVDRACAAAVLQAQAAWKEAQLHARTQALVALAGAVTAAHNEAEREAASVSQATAAAMLSMLAGALPAFCAAHGDAEVRTLMRHLLPTLQREKRVVVRVHPALAPIIAQDIALLDDDLAATVTVTPTSLPVGDIRVTWADGSFTRNTAKIIAAMQDVLAQLGLADQTVQRRMALAE